jgi:hypothetical protein
MNDWMPIMEILIQALHGRMFIKEYRINTYRSGKIRAVSLKEENDVHAL